ncbi:hypothetical protein BDGGKGIB_01165 [Nodularia sphaerocarpa UHCC 0038]|nr:hypothetical protein BDGGKGIB_01165 [Nodularia sphaerocarpa UHCC 0038]
MDEDNYYLPIPNGFPIHVNVNTPKIAINPVEINLGVLAHLNAKKITKVRGTKTAKIKAQP